MPRKKKTVSKAVVRSKVRDDVVDAALNKGPTPEIERSPFIDAKFDKTGVPTRKLPAKERAKNRANNTKPDDVGHLCMRCERRKYKNAFRQVGYNPMQYDSVCLSCRLQEKEIEQKDDNRARNLERAAERAVDPKKIRRDMKANRVASAKSKQAATRKRQVEAQKVSVESINASEAAKRELARRELLRKKLLYFVHAFHPEYKAGWVHADICARLERFYRDVKTGKNPRLMLFMPPRHGKSTLASKLFPTWLLGHDPGLNIIASSYGLTLPTDFSRYVRARMTEDLFKNTFPKCRLDPNKTNVENWGVLNEGKPAGEYIAAGVGTGIGGRGADILIVDDPLKDSEQADSEVVRRSVWDWFKSTAYIRLSPTGGVLIIMCMVGDTPVLMADGSHKELKDVRAGDEIATYDNGRLSTAVVKYWMNQGHDDIWKITTRSGRIVRANARHPFLVDVDGEPRWVRAKSLSTGQSMYRLRMVSGEARPVPWTDATNPPRPEGCATPTTPRRSGQTDTVLHRSTLSRAAERVSSIVMGLASMSMMLCSKRKRAGAPYVSSLPAITAPTLGSASTTATTPARSGRFSAMTATLRLGIRRLKRLFSRWLHTFDFTLDEIVHIEQVGREQVFDIQVDRTENFIANGLVSHNTRWHDDDLAGALIQEERELMADAESYYEAEMEVLVEKHQSAEAVPAEDIQRVMDDKEEMLGYIDQWEVVSYPAIADTDEYRKPDGVIVDAKPDGPSVLLRKKDEALHEGRWPYARLMRIYNSQKRRNLRHWHALYQQKPVPDEGVIFTTDMIQEAECPPAYVYREWTVLQAWDLAIGLKQQHNYSVGITGALDPDNRLWILHMVRGRWDIYGLANQVLDQYERFRPSKIGVERGPLELALMPAVKRELAERNKNLKTRQVKLTPYFLQGKHSLVPINDKLMRARPLESMMQQGAVFWSKGAPWLDNMRHEMLRFPSGVLEDCVDAAAWLARMSTMVSPPRKTEPKDPWVGRKGSWRERVKRIASGQRGDGDFMGA